MTDSSPQPFAPSPHPNRIQILIMFLIIPTVWNGLRFAEALVFWKTLQEYGARPGPLYAAVSGAFWFVCGIVLIAGVWTKKAWAWYATLGAAAGYPVWVWADRLLLQQPHANWPFGLAVTLVCILSVIVIMFTPKTKKYFRLRKEVHEHQ
jgi:hypothetical protein